MRWEGDCCALAFCESLIEHSTCFLLSKYCSSHLHIFLPPGLSTTFSFCLGHFHSLCFPHSLPFCVLSISFGHTLAPFHGRLLPTFLFTTRTPFPRILVMFVHGVFLFTFPHHIVHVVCPSWRFGWYPVGGIFFLCSVIEIPNQKR